MTQMGITVVGGFEKNRSPLAAWPKSRLDSPRVGMFDGDIRAALIRSLQEQDPTAAIVEEMPLLRGRGRADVVFANSTLCGFEIKSEHDSLVRLGTQTDQYQSHFEFVTLVVTRKHLRIARERIPKAWGILLAEQKADGKVKLAPKRAAQKNCQMDSSALARILWKQECVTALARNGVRARRQTPVIKLWNLLEALPVQVLCDEVRIALKERQRRQLGQPQTPCDDSLPTAPIELDLPDLHRGP
jgi:hypothetical protein